LMYRSLLVSDFFFFYGDHDRLSVFIRQKV
jgi:hypothetical protein